LASGKAALQEGYRELSRVIGSEQQAGKAIALIQQKEEISSLKSQVLLEREACLGGYMKNVKLMMSSKFGKWRRKNSRG